MENSNAIDLLWSTVDPDEEIHLQNGSRKLSDICAQKLVSDVSLINGYCRRLPKLIHVLVLSAAVTKKRILSVDKLMRFYPMKKLELPVPEILKSVHTLSNARSIEVKNELEDFNRISITMLSVFFDIMRNFNAKSELKTLDLGLIPLSRAALYGIEDLIMKIATYRTRGKYTLKCAVALENARDLHMFNVCTEIANSVGLNLDISGIYFYNNYFPDVQAIRMLDCISASDVQLFGFSFANIAPSFDSFFNGLKHFHTVKYLNLSYLSDVIEVEFTVSTFAAALIELPNLQRLVMKGIDLTNTLTMLFLGYCKKNQTDVTARNCCLVHNGSLHHLDISSCKLSDRDLEFLKEMALTDSLKYLDISGNSFLENRTFDTLLSLNSSLRALNISGCFRLEYDAVLFPLSSFAKLKYLNIKSLWETQRSIQELQHQLQKMPNLEVIESSSSLSPRIHM